jgi:hypothetical protein
MSPPVEKQMGLALRQLQISPLRFAPVEMTKGKIGGEGER